MIKETINTRWHGLKFFENVLLIISIPAEFDDRAKDTMRKCLYSAELTDSKESTNVEFTTERKLKTLDFLVFLLSAFFIYLINNTL